MGYTLIAHPVSPSSSRENIEDWLYELSRMPQDDGVKYAMEEVQQWLRQSPTKPVNDNSIMWV